MENIETLYGVKTDLRNPLPEHPNPYFERDSFLSLNGPWGFNLSQEPSLNVVYEKEIIVPYSVETRLSGINAKVSASDYMHYKKAVEIPSDKRDSIAHLVFSAIDQHATIYVDGEKLGESDFGYIPFELYFPINGREKITIEVIAHDDTDSPIYARGKQSNNPGGVWYHPTSGIWGSVYLEFLSSKGYIEHIDVSADYDSKIVSFSLKTQGESLKAKVDVFFDDKKIKEIEFDDSSDLRIDMSDVFHSWNAKNPNLYHYEMHYGEDLVKGAFAFRKIERRKIGDAQMLFVNGEPTFLSALLDQGYYPESGLTPPSIEAMENDIKVAKEMGFNVLRKHIKIEPMRWYYLCDSLGMYVIQDFVSGGSKYSTPWIGAIPFCFHFAKINDSHPKRLGRHLKESRDHFEEEMSRTYEHLKNVTSIVAWTLFNEGWGQFETVRLTEKLRSWNDGRLIDSSSGWYDKKVGDFSSYHIYWKPLKMKKDKNRILSLSEFGGYAMPIEGHMDADKKFGYGKYHKDKEELNSVIGRAYEAVRKLIKEKGLSVSVYTQLTDVEGEINGLMSYDRKIIKGDAKTLMEINESLYEEYRDLFKNLSNK